MLTPMADGVIGGPPPDSLNNIIQSQTPNINIQSHLNLSSNSTVLPSSYLAETPSNYHHLDYLPANNNITLEEDRRRSIGSYHYDDNNNNNVLGSVPSRIEVQKAISDLQR